MRMQFLPHGASSTSRIAEVIFEDDPIGIVTVLEQVSTYTMNVLYVPIPMEHWVGTKGRNISRSLLVNLDHL